MLPRVAQPSCTICWSSRTSGHHRDTVRAINDGVSAFEALTAPQLKMRLYALNEETLSPDADLAVVRTAFRDIRQQPRAEQKRRLRRSIEKYRKDRKLLADPATEVA